MAVSEIKIIREHDYMLLSRLITDCKYYLGYGNRHKKFLWAHDEEEQIKKMKSLYYGMPYHQRPQWLSETRLKYYCLKLTGKKLSEI